MLKPQNAISTPCFTLMVYRNIIDVSFAPQPPNVQTSDRAQSCCHIVSLILQVACLNYLHRLASTSWCGFRHCQRFGYSASSQESETRSILPNLQYGLSLMSLITSSISVLVVAFLYFFTRSAPLISRLMFNRSLCTD